MKRVFGALALCAATALQANATEYNPWRDIKDHYTQAELDALGVVAKTGTAKDELAYGKALYRAGKPNPQLWFRKAGEHGSGEGWFLIAYTTTDARERRSSLERAAELAFEPAFDEVFDVLLFRAAEQADVEKAKHFADIARRNGIKIYDPVATVTTIDACYAAGRPVVSAGDRRLVTADERNSQNFAPNDNIKYAQAYANGWGVGRNPKLALALVCHGANVPAELEGMVTTLTAMIAGQPVHEPFLFCQHVTSGDNGGQCSEFEEDLADARRNRFVADLSANWSPQQKAAFEVLNMAAIAYFNERAASELDMSGTARASIASDERTTLQEKLKNAITSFESGHVPPHGNFARADKELNAAYQGILRNTRWDQTGTVTPQGLRATQRLWLKYRNAWAVFGPLRYPQRSPDDWKAWVTQKRMSELTSTFGP